MQSFLRNEVIVAAQTPFNRLIHHKKMFQESQLVKRQRMERKPKVIGTHDGAFHCDEALAVFLLRQTTTYRASDVKRSRDPVVLDACDVVVDVGGVYDETKQRFDHHQRGFSQVFGYGFETKLSSAGLVYKHFGKEIIANKLQLAHDHRTVEEFWLKLYRDFIEALDAIDNGISQYPDKIKPRYRNRTDLSSRVGHLNPAWNEPFDFETQNRRFEAASEMAGREFMNRLDYYVNAWLPARKLVHDALLKRFEVESSGRILSFDQFLPWKEHVFELEAEESIGQDALPLYALYPEDNSGKWRIQAVPIKADSFESRKPLPEEWRGLRDDELSKVSGIDGCVFVHASGFTGGAKTKNGVLELARAALAA